MFEPVEPAKSRRIAYSTDKLIKTHWWGMENFCFAKILHVLCQETFNKDSHPVNL
jgi:hypothetical protein